VGEFILGYEDEESRVDARFRLPRAPAGALGRSSTYMVWRKLHQNVALFRETLRDAAPMYADGDEEKLAAKIVGRWRNGTPLVVSPDGEQPGFEPGTPVPTTSATRTATSTAAAVPSAPTSGAPIPGTRSASARSPASSASATG
jgi:hypothetical protein